MNVRPISNHPVLNGNKTFVAHFTNIYSYIYMNSPGTNRRFNLDAEKLFYSDPEVPAWCVISNWYPDQTASCRLIVVSNLPAFVKTEVVHLLTVTVFREPPE